MKKVVKRLKRLESRHASHTDDDRRTADHVHPMIAQRAYELYEQRGHAHGHDFEDWLEAEQQILNEPRRE